MARPKISVVVPTYNQAEYLGACLDSILFQDYPDLELIVVADPSPDETSAVLARFREEWRSAEVSYASRLEDDGCVSRTRHHRYPQRGREVVVLENETRLGHTPSYNKGFRMATGEYCTYVASDDVCHPQWLSEMAAPLERGEADFVYSDMFIFDDAGRILREFKLPDYSFEACFADWYLCGVSKLYRRELHERLGWYDEAYTANDHELYQRFALGGARFLHLPKTLYSVRTHEGRERDVHAAESWKRLMAESSGLVREARAALARGDV
ncbi:MAG: glycosyltransferase family 2 protein [Desulfovibrionaceae bacterium]